MVELRETFPGVHGAGVEVEEGQVLLPPGGGGVHRHIGLQWSLKTTEKTHTNVSVVLNPPSTKAL